MCRRILLAAHPETCVLTRMFWMNDGQVSTAKLYGDILVIDVCENRNLYRMYLTTLIVINGDNQARNVAYALHDSQDTDTFAWILNNFENAWRSESDVLSKFNPVKAIFSDRDLAIRKAIQLELPNAFHGLCLFHINENLRKNLFSKLGSSWIAFRARFWDTYRVGSESTFEEAWKELILRYPMASNYLSEYLYPCRAQWAWYSVGTHFCAGLRTTGSLEVEHKNFKLRALSPNSTLNESFRILTNRANEQADQVFAIKLQVQKPIMHIS